MAHTPTATSPTTDANPIGDRGTSVNVITSPVHAARTAEAGTTRVRPSAGSNTVTVCPSGLTPS
jgi:hypothetical protein